MRISGGTPSGIPDFRPVNPWGRPMPKPARKLRLPSEIHALYQVFVETRSGRMLAVGPKLTAAAAEQFAAAIRVQIIHGKEKRWSNPSVLCVPAVA